MLTRIAIRSLNADAYAVYSRDFGVADSLFTRAVNTAVTAGWTAEEAGARLNRGIVYFLTGRYAPALEEYQTALALYEEIEDEGGQAAVLVEMGNFFKKRKEIERARDHLDRAAELAEKAGNQRLLSNALDIGGQLLQQLGDYAGALSNFQRVLTIRRAINDTIGLSYVYEHLGSWAVERGAPGRALTYLDSTVYYRTLLGDRQGRAVAVNNQGEALLAAGDTVAAIAYLERSLGESTAIGFVDLQQWTSNLLARSYAATGQPRRALALQQRVQLLKDSLYDAATSQRIAEMQERFEADRREQELALQAAQLQQRTAWLVAAVLGVLVLLALLFILARHLRARQDTLRREADERLRNDRLRISRDLHDHLGAELSVVASDLGRLDRQLPGQHLAPVTKQVRYAMEQMRETIWAVRLEDADWTDLTARLRTFAAKLPHDNISIDLDPTLAERPLDPQRVLNLYRFCQEALANAVKHADAAAITLTATPTAVTISDDGRGFDPATATKGYGMASLRERAAELGGRLDIKTNPDAGTKVLLNFP